MRELSLEGINVILLGPLVSTRKSKLLKEQTPASLNLSLASCFVVRFVAPAIVMLIQKNSVPVYENQLQGAVRLKGRG
jgi:hypothetical protein